MDRFPIRLIVFVLFLIVVLILVLFTDLNHKAIMSLALIFVFLLLFTFIFKTDGFQNLKIFIIIFSFIVLPVFLLFYLGIFNTLSGYDGNVLAVAIVVLWGVISIFIMFKLSYVEIELK